MLDLKGKVSRDFLRQVFTEIIFSQVPEKKNIMVISNSGDSKFFRKFAEIFVSPGAPACNNATSDKFAIGVNLTGGKYWEQY